jgi:hypothetical protein
VAVLYTGASISNTTYIRKVLSKHKVRTVDLAPVHFEPWKDNLALNTRSLHICKCWTVNCDRVGIPLRLGPKGVHGTPIPITWIKQP